MLCSNNISNFEFHDAEVYLLELTENKIVLRLKHVNIHGNAEENMYADDMEIDDTAVTVYDANVLSYMIYSCVGSNEPNKTYYENRAVELFLNEQNGFTVMGVYYEGDKLEIEGLSGTTLFLVTIVFSSLLIEWNDYVGKAWYRDISK